MAPVKRSVIALAIACATPAHAESVATWQPFIREASLRFGIPSEWIERVMRAESGGQTQWKGRPIRSSAGAMGLMQLMPATWADMRMRLGLGNNPDDPRDNILAGTFYLRLMYDRFGYPGMFAAYNAGPGRYAEHLSGRRALPSETVGYLATVAPLPAKNMIVTSRPAPSQSIFAVRRNVPDTSSDTPSTTLFVALSNADER
ncbi:soluble lytic murein transglycosylase-like protein [Sphingobium sp. B1D7B]|uniref:lytic transglycosylase domain-containing protein n=1 Tax=Sphingobium sp. B1D7B TaxID=2940578 RepID=UPI002223F818|nr:lytic transglycosylase domain-containing protein [Sphingobium sp. B1D7B]MCW2406066.1 soluble lytic murein transglycosylase-like protein [Sphingobium sp. B1D7B]